MIFFGFGVEVLLVEYAWYSAHFRNRNKILENVNVEPEVNGKLKRLRSLTRIKICFETRNAKKRCG